jgi:Transcriptional regulator SbtR-like, C-terminal domain
MTDGPDSLAALDEWLRAFVQHVATKRHLAIALPDERDGERSARFAGWHKTMHDAASRLLARAQAAGVVRADLIASDLLALATGIALTGLFPSRIDQLLELIRHGYTSAGVHRGAT